jgi:AraC-like DNA-binding protein
VHEGTGLVMQSAHSALLNPNDVLVCGPASAAQFRASRLEELQLHSFQVNPELLSGVLSAFERQQLQATLRGVKTLHRFPPESAAAKQFESLSQPSVHPLHRRCQMLQLAAPILSEHLPAQSAPERFLSARERFAQLFETMPEAELQNRSPEELAKLCGCSVRHFSRLFREHFGHSLLPQRTALRIQRARQLLAETDAKIIDVALECGFQHVGQFTASFRRLTRMTPSEYRRRKQRRELAPA